MYNQMLTKMNYGMRNSDTYIMKSLALNKFKGIIRFISQMVNRPVILGILLTISLVLGIGGVKGQTFYDMSTGNYSQDFSNISGWTNSYASGTGAGNWRTATSVATSTVNTATVFVTSTTGGIQKGNNSMILLATGTNSSATDLLLNFTGRNAGTISLNWVKVTNSVNASPRSSDLKIQYSSDNGVTFADLTGYTIPRVLNNSTAESGSLSAITLPAALNNQSQVVIRFYVWNNGQTGGSGNRPKIQIDDIDVTSTAASSTPTLTTPTATSITDVSATLGATVSSDGGSALSARGTSYNTSSPVVAADNQLAEGGTSVAAFSHSRTGLSPQTQYFYAGYATNSSGTTLSNEGNFRTLSAAPTVQSSGVSTSVISSTQINLNITAATFPGSGATQAGYVVIYSTGTPTLSSTNGQAPAAGVGSIFSTSATVLPSTPSTAVNITGLTPATAYNFLVVPYTWDGTNATTYNYLTTSAPTATASTNSGAPALSLPTATSITHNAATLGATVDSDGGSALTARGTSYKTSSPVIATDNQLAEGGTSVASFSHSRTGLSSETEYFYVGYATNSSATSISSEGSFRTLSSPPTVQAGLSATAFSTSQIDLTITAATFPGSGATQAGYVVIYATGTPTFTATNGQAPAAGVGTIFSTSATVLPTTPSTTVNVTGLTQSTLYNFLVIPYTWDGTNASTYNYLTASAPTANATTQGPVTIAVQDFESSPATPTWNYTGGGASDNTANKFNGASAYRISGSQTLTMDNINISAYTNVNLSVAYAGSGPDSGEDLYMDISYDNGTTWNGTGSIKLVDGFSNTNLNINTINLSGPTTVANNPWVTSIGASETQIRVRFRIDAASSATEYYWIDDVNITGTLNTSPTISVTPTSLTGFSQTSSSPSSEQTYTVTGNNLTGNVSIVPPTGYEISTTTGGSFSATNPITLNASGGDIVGEPVTIYVRQNSSTLGAVSGNISHTSTGANNPNVAVSGTRTGTYYSKSTGNLDDLTTWGLNTDGTGTAPANFTTDGVIFEIRNRATATIGANWTVSGTASKVVIGDGTNAVDFTIPSGFSLTGTIDVSDNAELTIENTTAPTFGTFATNSTLEYNNVAVTLSTSTTYRNLKLSGSGTKTFPGGTITVAGNLTLDGCTFTGASSSPFSTLLLGGNLNYIGTVTPPADANSITLTTNGTASGTQTITGAGNTVRWFRIQTTTANTILLSSVGGSSNILLGNNSGGGITLVDGSILDMNGNDFTLFNNISTTNAFLFNSTGSISTNSLTDITIERSGNGNLGTLRFTSGTNTIGNLTLNHSGSTNNTVVIGNTLNIAGTLTLTAGVFDANNVTTLNSASSLIYNGGSMINYTIPTSLNNFTLPTGTTTLSNDISLTGNLNLGSNTLDIGSNTLTVNGDITRTTGTIKTNGGIIVLGGTGSSTLHFDQTTDGTTNKLKDLTINRTGATVTLGSKLQIAHNGTVTVTAGTLAASGNLVLTSTLGGTARIAELAAGAAVSGNVEIQRYMVGGASSQRGWRYMSSPVASSTYAQLIDDIFITGPGGASNGFDWTGNSSSVMTYEESSSRGWKNITSPSNTWNPGKGAIVFFRGDRTQTSSITNTNVAPNSFALDYSGNINSGSFTINLDYDNTTGVAANQGWNLIGNPYPSQIDWDLVTKTSGVNSHYYLINPTSKNYLSANTGIIAIGQGFFVQVNASGQSVSFEENDKTSSNGTAYFKTASNPISIKMHLDSVQNDVAKIFFVTGASKNYLFTEDAIKLNNAVYNLSIVTPNNIDVQNSYVPHLGNTGTDTFELKVTSTTNTSYYLSFDNFAQIPSGKAILLLDKQNNSITNLRLNGNYQFAINNSQSSSFGNRFLLIITDQHNSLPLKLTQFSGASKGLTNELTWVTVSEKNIIGFEVQKSDDGFDFETIGFVKANNQQSTSKYLYTDNQSKNTKVYYRLKINERNLVTFSHVVVLNNELQQNLVNQLQVFPNPAQNSLSINLIDNNNIGKIYVFDLFGKLMQQHDGVSQIDVSKLSSGSYIIQVEVNDITYRVKFTKN